MNNFDQCPKCGIEARSLYENPKPKLLVTRGKGQVQKEFLCFDCLDRIAPEYVNKYPGWRERQVARRRRADLATRNFQQSGKLSGASGKKEETGYLPLVPYH